MKLKYKIAIKYYNETDNKTQLDFAYQEIETFMETYSNFKWFYKFDIGKIER